MKMIVAVAKDWAIGYNGQLLAHNKEDMKFFRDTTTGNLVVMGRKTLESFPGGRPLKNRDNLVLTTDASYVKEGAVIVHTVEEALKQIKEYEVTGKDCFIIGGESIYRQFLPFCDTCYVTKMDAVYPADTFFPDLDLEKDWKLTEQSEQKEYPDGTFIFCTYQKQA